MNIWVKSLRVTRACRISLQFLRITDSIGNPQDEEHGGHEGWAEGVKVYSLWTVPHGQVVLVSEWGVGRPFDTGWMIISDTSPIGTLIQ